MMAHIGTTRNMEYHELCNALQHFKFSLMRKAAGAWPAITRLPLLIHDWENESTYEIQAGERPKVQNLITAEGRLGLHGENLSVGDMVGRLTEETYIGPTTITGPILMWRRNKMAKKEIKEDYIMHYIKEGNAESTAYTSIVMRAGSFVFEIFATADIWVGIENIIDDQGRQWRADDRVWCPIIFLSCQKREQDAIVAYGTYHRFGLTDGCLDHIAKTMIELSNRRRIWIPARIATSVLLGQTMTAEENIHMTSALVGAVTAMAWNRHWFLVYLHVQGQVLHVEVWDGEDPDYYEQLSHMASKIKRTLGIAVYNIEIHRSMDQIYPFTCGTVALQHLGIHLGIWSTKNAPDQLHWHQRLSAVRCEGDQLCGWGKSMVAYTSEEKDAMWKLRDLLQQHGVPEDRTEERAMAALAKMGLQKMQEALSSKNQWAALKALGSQPLSEHAAGQTRRAGEADQAQSTEQISGGSINQERTRQTEEG